MQLVSVNYPPWNGSPAYRDLSVVTDLIIHHSDGPPTQTPLEIDAEHRAEGWCGIGYHLVIAPDGTVYRGRPLTMVPAAAQDDNTNSVDVCLLGDFEPGTDGYSGAPPAAQVQALKDVVLGLHQQIPSIERTIGHRDVAQLKGDPSVSTACPGDVLYALLPSLRSYVSANLLRTS